MKALVLCVVALALLALTASLGQAELGAKWTIKLPNGTTVDAASLEASIGIKELELLEETKERYVSLITKMIGQKVEIICTGAALVNVKLAGEGHLAGGGKAKFTGCQIKINGKVEKECTPHVESESGVIISNELKSLIVLHSGIGITRIEGSEKEILARIPTSEECALGEELLVIGKFMVKDSKLLELLLVEHLISEGPLTEIWVNSKTVEHKATISTTAVLKLTGPHEAMAWSGTPS